MGQNNDSIIFKKIYDEALSNSPVYDNLRYLCKEIGHRLSGSSGAAAAVNYTKQLMESYDFDTVFLQPVMVPHWVRDRNEEVRVVRSIAGSFALNGLTIGNSVGTGSEGIRADVIEVSGLEEVEELGESIKGKIVFYNGKMDPTLLQTFRAYGNAVRQRSSGASVAAKYGARAVVIRSITQSLDDTPHTGALRYAPNIHHIPSFAISTRDADKLSSLMKQEPVEIYLKSLSEMKGEVLSYNVIGQITGSEYPNEFIAVGGHLDSWDVGEGAHDDGAGCMQAIEALRLMKELDLKPKRSIRAVMWMNEENGLRGGREYARVAEEKGEIHLAAIESDRGGFLPVGFTSTGLDHQVEKFKSWKPLFLPYGLYNFDRPGGGADIGPLAQQGTFLIGLLPDGQRYFRYHHTPDD
ncbi:MAG: M20/M25/M40 family metallo-hydrolase, partial [Proteobacteria bacterium]|nr:M20/M25/M40 family metallo-hydrolase [Pseudomonadota bacterium]